MFIYLVIWCILTYTERHFVWNIACILKTRVSVYNEKPLGKRLQKMGGSWTAIAVMPWPSTGFPWNEEMIARLHCWNYFSHPLTWPSMSDGPQAGSVFLCSLFAWAPASVHFALFRSADRNPKSPFLVLCSFEAQAGEELTWLLDIAFSCTALSVPSFLRLS